MRHATLAAGSVSMLLLAACGSDSVETQNPSMDEATVEAVAPTTGVNEIGIPSDAVVLAE